MQHGKRTTSKVVIVATMSILVATIVGMLGGSAGAATAAGNPKYSTRPAQGGGSGTAISGGLGATVSPALKVSQNVNITNGGESQSETTIAADPTNKKHLLASVNDKLDSFTNTNNAYESFDGGKTWTNTNLNPGAFCYDTWADFNAAGDEFISYECSDQRYAYKLHGTNTWVKTTFSAALAGGFPDRDMLVVDTGVASPFKNSVYIGYDDNGSNNKPFVLYSRDGITGWTRSPKINDTNALTIGVNVSVGPDGTVYASWLDFANRKLMMDVSHDGGATWGVDRVAHTYRANTTGFSISIPPQNVRGIVPFPMSTAAQSGPFAGRLYEAYEDKSPTGADFNAYLEYSDDGGLTWSPEVMVNDDGVGAYQFFPRVVVAPNGMVGYSFYDTRGDVPANRKTDRYVAFSSNGGATFGANIRVTTAQTDETTGSFNSNQYGDYEGMDAGPTGAFFLVWTDRRTGLTNEDMMYSRVEP